MTYVRINGQVTLWKEGWICIYYFIHFSSPLCLAFTYPCIIVLWLQQWLLIVMPALFIFSTPTFIDLINKWCKCDFSVQIKSLTNFKVDNLLLLQISISNVKSQPFSRIRRLVMLTVSTIKCFKKTPSSTTNAPYLPGITEKQTCDKKNPTSCSHQRNSFLLILSPQSLLVKLATTVRQVFR